MAKAAEQCQQPQRAEDKGKRFGSPTAAVRNMAGGGQRAQVVQPSLIKLLFDVVSSGHRRIDAHTGQESQDNAQ